METTFYNVTICVDAKTPREAYSALCDALGKIECEWETDTYSEGNMINVQAPTSFLWGR